MSILMCRPTFYGVEYEINPWMKPDEEYVDRDLAIEQWLHLKLMIEECGETVVEVEPQPGLPDMVFTANAGFIYDGTAHISRFKHKERQGEEDHFYNWFSDNGYKTIKYKDIVVGGRHWGFHEGAGDILYEYGRFWHGHGFRSDIERCTMLWRHHGGLGKFISIKLNDPRFYHLDTCLCPLKKDLIMAYEDIMSEYALDKFSEEDVEVISPPPEEAAQFACNSIVIGNKVIMPSDCDKTQLELERHGFTVLGVPMSEFIKAGGACKCLTLVV